MFTFLHAADIHLDSPLRGLERYEGAPADAIRSATRRALERLVDLAIDRRVDFVLLAGDLYDGDWPDYNTGLYFVQQMARLAEAAISVIAISGNHDAANKMTRSLPLPRGFTMLSARHAETVQPDKLHDLGVAIHGRSFARPAETDNLAASYPQARPGLFNIGLLHTSLTGAEGHEPYAPCTLDDLRARAYDYWALGHVHERRVACEDPHVVYPGNIQGRHIREPGAKGCELVTVGERGEVELEFQALDVLRWERCAVSAGGATRPDEILDRVGQALSETVARHQGLPLAVRVVIEGRAALHDGLVADPLGWINQVRAAAVQVGGDVWIEKVEIRTRPERTRDLQAVADGPLAELGALIDELRGEVEAGGGESTLEAVLAELSDLDNKLRADPVRGEVAPDLQNPEWRRRMLDEVESLLMARLRGEEER